MLSLCAPLYACRSVCFAFTLSHLHIAMYLRQTQFVFWWVAFRKHGEQNRIRAISNYFLILIIIKSAYKILMTLRIRMENENVQSIDFASYMSACRAKITIVQRSVDKCFGDLDDARSHTNLYIFWSNDLYWLENLPLHHRPNLSNLNRQWATLNIWREYTNNCIQIEPKFTISRLSEQTCSYSFCHCIRRR